MNDRKLNANIRRGQVDLDRVDEEVNRNHRADSEAPLEELLDSFSEGFDGREDEVLAHLEWAKDRRKDLDARIDFYERGIARIRGEIEGYIRLENITYDDGLGNIVHHPVVYVAKDVPRTEQPNERGHTHQRLTSYRGIAHFQGVVSPAKGFVPVLPHYRLSVAIVKKLLQTAVKREDDGTYKTLNEEHKKVLDHYIDHGAGFGWHGQNTIITDDHRYIIDFPHEEDFPVNDSGILEAYRDNSRPNDKGINEDWQTRRIPIPKDLTSWQNCHMNNLRPDSAEYKYVVAVSGETPNFFIEWAQYCGRNPMVWTPDRDRFNSAWFGCDSRYLGIDTGGDLDDYNACRGVLLSAEGAYAKISTRNKG